MFRVRNQKEDKAVEFWLTEDDGEINLNYSDPEDGVLCILKVSNDGVRMLGWGAGTTFPKGDDCQVRVID